MTPTSASAAAPQWQRWTMGYRRMLAVRVPDVDLNARQVVLRHTKNGEERVAYINALAMAVFESMNLRLRKQRGDRGLLWPGVTPEQVSMRFIRAARLAGAPEGTSFHTLRHTYATQLKLKGRDLDVVYLGRVICE